VLGSHTHPAGLSSWTAGSSDRDAEQAAILLLAADEGITMARRRATSVLIRRMERGIAEWYVLDMLEKSWASRSTPSGLKRRATSIRVRHRKRPTSSPPLRPSPGEANAREAEVSQTGISLPSAVAYDRAGKRAH
jgi:hypothetical protein